MKGADISISNRLPGLLCHQVGAEVCQEGVEDEDEYRLVLAAQADYIQGFWFGRPMTVGQLIERFEKKQ